MQVMLRAAAATASFHLSLSVLMLKACVFTAEQPPSASYSVFRLMPGLPSLRFTEC